MKQTLFDRRLFWFIGFGLMLWTAGCRSAESSTLPLPSAVPALLPTPTLALPDETGGASASAEWQTIAPGREIRTITLYNEQGLIIEEISILRLDPAFHTLKVGYRPGDPQSLPVWLAETGAVAVANGGYFTPDFLATGLVVVDGQPFGSSYGSFAGMLAMTDAGSELAWLAERPSLPTESITYGLQSFPVLVKPGGVADYPDDGSAPSRRTVMAQDRSGHMLLLVANWGYFSLHALSQFLGESDLDLDIAVNLDGGTSSGLIVANSGLNIAGYVSVPAVVLVFPRE